MRNGNKPLPDGEGLPLSCEAGGSADWLDGGLALLDAMTRLVNRRRYQPDDETLLRRQIRERTAANLAHARAALAGSPLNVLAVEGGWYAIAQAPRVRSEEEWALELLDREGVLVQPGFFYDFDSEAFLVLSLLTPREVFGEGLGRLRRMAEV